MFCSMYKCLFIDMCIYMDMNNYAKIIRYILTYPKAGKEEIDFGYKTAFCSLDIGHFMYTVLTM